MKRTILASAIVLLGFSFSTMGCSRAAAICEITCECEHCNDQAQLEVCNQLGTAEDLASAYDCSDKWEAYTVCVEERGTCDAKESRFSIANDMGKAAAKTNPTPSMSASEMRPPMMVRSAASELIRRPT